MLGFLAARAVAGVEEVVEDRYVRALDGEVRSFAALDLAGASSAGLAPDPVLGPLALGDPVRVPLCVDGGEIAIRAVLGQQVSVAAARTLAGRLAVALGRPLAVGAGSVLREFPTAAALADAPDALLAMPGARRRAVRALAAALAGGLDPRSRDALLELPGIGPWTADYVALRLGDPDVLLTTDLAVRHAARRLGLPSEARALAAHGERWAPHRSAATVLLWASLAPDRASCAPGRGHDAR